MRAEGMTQQAIADAVGIVQSVVNDVLSEKQVYTPNTDKPKRKWDCSANCW